jgi:DNA-binding transcriptional ArsR family regulator
MRKRVMEQGKMVEKLLAFFKALSDANRLKIVALLAQEPRPVEQLASMLGVSSPTVSHHLARLSKVGLVTARAEGYYSVYSLEPQALSEMVGRVLSKDALPAVAADVDGGAYDRKVLTARMTSLKRLRTFPVQRKKEDANPRHVANAFAKGRRDTEKQADEIFSGFSED